MTEQIKTVLRGVACLLVTATTALALPGTPWKRAELFATCSGRMAALATNQQALKDPGWSATQSNREMFDLLLDTTLPEAMAHGVPQGEAERWRAGGWTEVAVLLADVSYSFDPLRAHLAQEALSLRIEDCKAVILPLTGS